MNTEDRKAVRSLAQTMEACFVDDPEGLKRAQDNACETIEMLHLLYPNESDETLCVAARAVSYVLASMVSWPLSHVSLALERMLDSWTMSAGALAGVYELPEHDVASKPVVAAAGDDQPGGYL